MRDADLPVADSPQIKTKRLFAILYLRYVRVTVRRLLRGKTTQLAADLFVATPVI
jgi:hypothetical protein